MKIIIKILFYFTLFIYSIIVVADELELTDSEVEHYNLKSEDLIYIINPNVIIPKSDYTKLNIKPLYSDSIVYYSNFKPVEIKLFNEILMINYLDKNTIRLIDTIKYKDGLYAIWNIGCEVDKITDGKSCYVTKVNNFIYFKESNSLSSISIGAENWDYFKPSYIRVDKNKAFKVNEYLFYRPMIDNILKEMIQGDKAYFRYYKKYESSYSDNELSLRGFSTAYEIVNLLYSQVK